MAAADIAYELSARARVTSVVTGSSPAKRPARQRRRRARRTRSSSFAADLAAASAEPVVAS
ncbi:MULTISPECIES: hypothetical protein [Amycolatopsis]|uniref:hypothetical protein n=1 Tax=Amycolatopsis TaxID=1813 RepID=UPI001C71ACF0|nr:MULTISPECIES: hypothetical protein [Amycolatopsis]UKD56730.1 hypothetical protein L3Q65_08415 [Amycolatopsis sp. FU40]